MINKNTPVSTNRLLQLEEVIKGGLKSFIDVGAALAEIRHSKLYKLLGYKSFSSYCEERWGMVRRNADRLIKASVVVENISSSTDREIIENETHGSQKALLTSKSQKIPTPCNERQIRPLTKLKPQLQPVAWHRAALTAPDGKITERHVKKVVKEMLAEQYEDSIVENPPELPTLKIGSPVQIQLTNKSERQLNQYDRTIGIVEKITELGLVVVKVWGEELPPLKTEEVKIPTATTKMTVELPTETIAYLMEAGFSSVGEALEKLRSSEVNFGS